MLPKLCIFIFRIAPVSRVVEGRLITLCITFLPTAESINEWKTYHDHNDQKVAKLQTVIANLKEFHETSTTTSTTTTRPAKVEAKEEETFLDTQVSEILQSIGKTIATVLYIVSPKRYFFSKNQLIFSNWEKV